MGRRGKKKNSTRRRPQARKKKKKKRGGTKSEKKKKKNQRKEGRGRDGGKNSPLCNHGDRINLEAGEGHHGNLEVDRARRRKVDNALAPGRGGRNGNCEGETKMNDERQNSNEREAKEVGNSKTKKRREGNALA